MIIIAQHQIEQLDYNDICQLVKKNLFKQSFKVGYEIGFSNINLPPAFKQSFCTYAPENAVRNIITVSCFNPLIGCEKFYCCLKISMLLLFSCGA